MDVPARPVAPARKVAPPPDGSRRVQSAAAPKTAYKVIKDYNANDTSELSLRIGEEITVTSTDGDIWSGKLRGRFGTFPANCVEPIVGQFNIVKRGRGRGRGARASLPSPVHNGDSGSPAPIAIPLKAPSRGGPPSRGTPPTRGTPPSRGGASSLRSSGGPPTRGSPRGSPRGRGGLKRGRGSLNNIDRRAAPPPIAVRVSSDDSALSSSAPLPSPLATPPRAAAPPPSSVPPPTAPRPSPTPVAAPPTKIEYLSPMLDTTDIEQLPESPGAPPIPERTPPSSPREPLPEVPPRSPAQARRGLWAMAPSRASSTPTVQRHSLGASRKLSNTDITGAGEVPQEEKGGKSAADLRGDVLREMYITERDYVEDLDTMINVFIFPLRAMKLVPDNVLYNIFSNAEVLIGTNQEFLRGLDEVFPDGEDSITPDAVIGNVFLKMADYFKMYKVYCANQQASLNEVEDQKKKNQKFKHYLEVCHSDARCKGLFLQSFLIKPIQRVCKYPLLLRELIKHTPEDHPDFQPLEEAMAKIKSVVDNINEGQRTFEGLQRIIELQNIIEGVPDLVAPGRRLHREGDIKYHKSNKSKPEMRHVFVLSDMIVLTTKKGTDKYEHKMCVMLDNCKLIVMADSPYIKNGFEIQQELLKHKCILSFDTVEEQNVWVKDIKRLIKEFQKKKLRDLAEAKKKAEQGESAALSDLPPGSFIIGGSSPAVSRR